MTDIGAAGDLLELSEPNFDAPPRFADSDERRMHVRAYNYWASLLRGRAFPSVADLDPSSLDDFGPHSVLLDFTASRESPTLRFIGKSLREECGLPVGQMELTSVPSRSLISRLTDHFLEIIANRAPVGFEAEFVSQRGHNTLYRGILMPLSSDGDDIDFIYGVINWKEIADADIEASLILETEAAGGWSLADDDGDDGWTDALDSDAGLADRLAHARAAAREVEASDSRSRAALYRALAQAYDFHLAAADAPEELAAILADAGIAVQARAPMTAVAKLVFGAGYDKARLTEFAAALAAAARAGVPAGGFHAHVAASAGGLKALVAAERAARRGEAAASTRGDRNALIAERLRHSAPAAHVALRAEGDSEFVLLIGRRDGAGIAVLDAVPDSDALVTAALTRLRRARR